MSKQTTPILNKLVIANQDDCGGTFKRFRKGDIGIVIDISNDSGTIVMVKWDHIACPKTDKPNYADAYTYQLDILENETTKILYG